MFIHFIKAVFKSIKTYCFLVWKPYYFCTLLSCLTFNLGLLPQRRTSENGGEAESGVKDAVRRVRVAMLHPGRTPTIPFQQPLSHPISHPNRPSSSLHHTRTHPKLTHTLIHPRAHNLDTHPLITHRLLPSLCSRGLMGNLLKVLACAELEHGPIVFLDFERETISFFFFI